MKSRIHVFKGKQTGRGVVWFMVGINILAVLVTLLTGMGGKTHIQAPVDHPPEQLAVTRYPEFFLHCGAFQDELMAQARSRVLAEMGLQSTVKLQKSVSGVEAYAVIAGPVVTRDLVLEVRERLHKMGVDTIKLRQLPDGSMVAGG